jgi:hypothetical protein
MLNEVVDSSDWLSSEIKDANIGDARLNKRFGNVLEMLMRKPTQSIPAVSKNWVETKAAYRFFDNPKVTSEAILKPHKDAAIKRMKQESIRCQLELPVPTTRIAGF